MPLTAAKDACVEQFPPGIGALHMQAQTHIVISHRRRMGLNQECQQEALKRYRETCPDGLVVHIEAAEVDGLNKPQEFDLFEGTCLVGANNDLKDVVNGGFMVVGAVRESDCDITDEFGETFTLGHSQVARCTRLAWAITVTANQSRGFDNKVCLWDLDSPYYSKNDLVVATSSDARQPHDCRAAAIA